MKYFLIIIITIAMFSITSAQNKVYDKDGKNLAFSQEDIDLIFSPSPVKFLPAPPEKQKEVAGSLLALIPTAVDVAFKTTTKILEKNAKEFSGEYSKQKSYLEAGDRVVPNFKFIRKITIDGNQTTALEISIVAEAINKVEAFIYYVDQIELNYSAAKTASNSKVFDYTIEIKATINTEEESNVLDLSPIVISSVTFNRKKSFEAKKHRSNLINLPKGGFLTNISMKVVETNPLKIRAEKISSLWNDYKDEGKTIVNNFLPKTDKTEEKDQSTGSKDTPTSNGGISAEEADKSAGNGMSKKQ